MGLVISVAADIGRRPTAIPGVRVRFAGQRTLVAVTRSAMVWLWYKHTRQG